MYWPGVRVVVWVKRIVDMLLLRGGRGQPARQNAQWCTEAKFHCGCGSGWVSESTAALRFHEGQGTAGAGGVPVPPKVVQAVRMLAASASWFGFSAVANGAFG